ncbi:hypothetical protein TNCT1_54950 [Streptomyces sp. 1-11]|nr:hypothetical protein TNCT1_54950 [Streptomyces sp. 1-11]
MRACRACPSWVKSFGKRGRCGAGHPGEPGPASVAVRWIGGDTPVCATVERWGGTAGRCCGGDLVRERTEGGLIGRG